MIPDSGNLGGEKENVILHSMSLFTSRRERKYWLLATAAVLAGLMAILASLLLAWTRQKVALNRIRHDAR